MLSPRLTHPSLSMFCLNLGITSKSLSNKRNGGEKIKVIGLYYFHEGMFFLKKNQQFWGESVSLILQFIVVFLPFKCVENLHQLWNSIPWLYRRKKLEFSNSVTLCYSGPNLGLFVFIFLFLLTFLRCYSDVRHWFP